MTMAQYLAPELRFPLQLPLEYQSYGALNYVDARPIMADLISYVEEFAEGNIKSGNVYCIVTEHKCYYARSERFCWVIQ